MLVLCVWSPSSSPPPPYPTGWLLQLLSLWKQLFSHKALAIHVQGFYPRDGCRALTDYILTQPTQTWMVRAAVVVVVVVNITVVLEVVVVIVIIVVVLVRRTSSSSRRQ